MPRTFTSSVPFSGAPQSAIEHATSVLSTVAFRITEIGENTLTAHGPGFSGTKQSALRCASIIRLRVGTRSIEAEAELGSLDKMRNFLIGLPLLLGVLFLIVFGFMFWERGAEYIIMMSLGPLAPWPFITPLIVRSQRKRFEREFEIFLSNMALVLSEGR